MNNALGIASIYGVRLGDDKNSILELFGQPSRTKSVEGTEEWSWLKSAVPDYVRFGSDGVHETNGDAIFVDGVEMDRSHSREHLWALFPELQLDTTMSICEIFRVRREDTELKIAFFVNGGNKYTLRRLPPLI